MRHYTEVSNRNLACYRYPDLRGLKIAPSRPTLRDWIRRGIFPAPIRLGPRTIAWLVRDIEVWIEARAGKSENRTANGKKLHTAAK